MLALLIFVNKNDMKKLLLLTLLALPAFVASGQTYVFKSVTNATTVDTVTNTGVKNLQIAKVNGGAVGSIQANVTKLTGTQGGVIRLLGSLDGTNWARVNPTDSLIVPNTATATKVFDVSPTKLTYYRVQYTGTGTMSSTIGARIFIRK